MPNLFTTQTFHILVLMLINSLHCVGVILVIFVFFALMLSRDAALTIFPLIAAAPIHALLLLAHGVHFSTPFRFVSLATPVEIIFFVVLFGTVLANLDAEVNLASSVFHFYHSFFLLGEFLLLHLCDFSEIANLAFGFFEVGSQFVIFIDQDVDGFFVLCVK